MNVQARLDPKDVQHFTRHFSVVLLREAKEVTRRLSTRAAQHLARLDRGLGHPFIASLWTATPVREHQDGTFRATVYNRAESVTFNNRTTRFDVGRVRIPGQFPVKGNRVLAILEGGAKRHPISPRGRYRWLHLPWPRDAKGQDASVEQRRFVPDHPGVQGNRNVATTRELFLRSLNATAMEAAKSVAIHLK